MFTRGEKIATLNRWRQAILEELVAAGEVKRARLLSEIEEARSRLCGAAGPERRGQPFEFTHLRTGRALPRWRAFWNAKRLG